MPLLSVEDLTIQFATGPGARPAVESLSFTVESGEILAIVGESGSGKSVTALSLMQLLPPTTHIQGKALFTSAKGVSTDLFSVNQRLLRSIRGNQVSMIFQEPMTSLNPGLTIGYQLREAIRTHKNMSAREEFETAVRLLQRVQLPDPEGMMKRYPHQLSGGQQQRLMIAMAISCRPSLLIADEPTTALDVTVQRAILGLIRELQQEEGMGMLFITHDLGLVADIADRVLVLYQGRAVEYGKAADILRQPSHPYTNALLQCRPALHRRGEPLPVGSYEGVVKAQPLAVDNNTLLTQLVSRSALLEVKDLVVEFPAPRKLFGKKASPFRALDQVSFTVQPGEIFGLVGESGCGKSTLAKTILQLLTPTSGEVLLNGRNLHHRVSRRDLQIVFQDPFGSLNPRLTIGEAIAEPLKVHGLCKQERERHERVVQLLESVRLQPDHFYRYPHQFSGGQRQRICIARALALEPSFLVFDESVSALDVSVQAQVLNLLLELRSSLGFSAIFISHDLSVVRYVCNRMMVMQQGRIVEEGYSDDLFTNPRHPCTQALIAAIPGKSLLSSNPPY